MQKIKKLKVMTLNNAHCANELSLLLENKNMQKKRDHIYVMSRKDCATVLNVRKVNFYQSDNRTSLFVKTVHFLVHTVDSHFYQ